MRRAPVPLIGLIDPFKMALTRASCAGFAIASPKGAAFGLLRCAAAAFLAASLTACGTVRPSLPPPPVILSLPDCPAPARPALPRIDGALPFDAPGNVAAILERDDTFRQHITALEAALACFRRQNPTGENSHD